MLGLFIAAILAAASAYTAFAFPTVTTVDMMPERAIDKTQVDVILYKSALTDSGNLKATPSCSGDIKWDSSNKVFYFPAGTGTSASKFSFTIEKGGRYVMKDDWIDVLFECTASTTMAAPGASEYGDDYNGRLTVYNLANMQMGNVTEGMTQMRQKQTWKITLKNHRTGATISSGSNFPASFGDLDVADTGTDGYNSEWSEGVELIDGYDTGEILIGKKYTKGVADHVPTELVPVNFPGTNHPWIHGNHVCHDYQDSTFAVLAESGFNFTWRGRNCGTFMNITSWPTPYLDSITKAPSTQEVDPGGTATFTATVRLPHVHNEAKFKSIVFSDMLEACFDGSKAKLTKVQKKISDGEGDTEWIDVTSNWGSNTTNRFTYTSSSNTVSAAASVRGENSADTGATGLHKFTFTVPLKSNADYSVLSGATSSAGWPAKKTTNDCWVEADWVDPHDSEVETAEVINSNTVNVIIPMYANLTDLVTKVDQDSGTASAQGDASLKDAEFTLYYYADQSLTHTGESGYKAASKFKSDASGKVAFSTATGDPEWGYKVSGKNVLPMGSYVIKETKASSGYKASSTYYRMRVSAGTSGVTLSKYTSGGAAATDPLKVDEPIKRGSVQIQKLDADWHGTPPQGDASFAGATFTVYNVSTAAVYYGDPKAKKERADDVASNNVVGSVKVPDGAAESGLVTMSGLPVGKYKVKETAAPAGYDVNSSWTGEFEIKEDGETVYLTGAGKAVEDTVWRGKVLLGKVDADWLEGRALMAQARRAGAGRLHAPGPM